jgi:hypothetical protein
MIGKPYRDQTKATSHRVAAALHLSVRHLSVKHARRFETGSEQKSVG